MSLEVLHDFNYHGMIVINGSADFGFYQSKIQDCFSRLKI